MIDDESGGTNFILLRYALETANFTLKIVPIKYIENTQPMLFIHIWWSCLILQNNLKSVASWFLLAFHLQGCQIFCAQM
jgi:hypothetical protein